MSYHGVVAGLSMSLHYIEINNIMYAEKTLIVIAIMLCGYFRQHRTIGSFSATAGLLVLFGEQRYIIK